MQMSPGRQRLFLLLMLISGFAGISYEILYGRIIGNLIGDQFAVSAAILITFLLGIGIGSRYAWRLWPWLWLIELLIGLCGAAFALGTDALDALLYAGLPLLPSGLPGSIIACVVLLLLPAFLIGCSVPLFAGYMSRLSSQASFPTAYAIYNFGAALTAILIEYLLLRWFGIRGAVFSFVALNVAIAIILRFGFVVAPLDARPERLSIWRWPELIPVSMASAVFQLLMVKVSEMLLGPFRESFALVLSIVLLGIAVGSLLVRRFRIPFRGVALFALFAMLLAIIAFEPVAYLYAGLYETASQSYFAMVLLKWNCLFLLMGLPSIAFGATVPALIGRDSDQVSRESGQLLFVAAMANVAGFLLMVFVLHRYLDYGVILLVISMLTAIALPIHTGWQPRDVLAGAVLLLAGALIYTQQWDEELLYVSYTKFRSVERLESARADASIPERFKGYQDVFAINRVNGRPYFFINGYNSIPLNNPSEKIVGAISSYYAPHTDDALVLGLGSGATASVVGQLFEQTDVVEINPVVRENLFRMKQWNFDIESNPRVNIIVDDAIHYTKAADKTYDLILNTVTTPLYFSSSKLYTRDFLSVVKSRLAADGVYVTWMDARVGDRGVDIILNTIRSSFRYCALLYIKSSYFLLICSDQPVSAGALPHFAPGHEVYDDLLANDGITPQWLKYQLLLPDVLPLASDGNVRLNEADYPALEFEMAQLSGRGIPEFKQRLREAMSLEKLKPALEDAGEFYPAELVWHTVLMLRNSSFTRRWKALAADYSADFEVSYLAVQQRYYDRLAQAGASAKAFHEFGYRLMKSRQFREAIRSYRRALELDPEHNNTHFNMAACYERLGELDNALRFYRKEAEVDPADEDVPYRIGRVLVKMQRFDEALTQLHLAERVMGGNVHARVYEYMGQAYEGLDQPERARAAFKQAKEVYLQTGK